MQVKCSKCNNPIENSTSRLFLNSDKTKQVCSQCWWQECRNKFPKDRKGDNNAKFVVGRN